ncbi:hypothetical protein YC2023_019957 [Brassica napus]
MLAGILRKNGVADQGINFDTGARTALAFVTLKANGDREFMFYRNHSADMLLRPDELNLELIRSVPLIPLSEFSEAAVMKKYGVKPDAETLDIANTAARQKSVKKIPPLSPIPQHPKLGLHILITDKYVKILPFYFQDDNGKCKQPCCEQRRMTCCRREGSPLSSVLILLREPDNRCMS